MTWQQITVTCPWCGAPRQTHHFRSEYVHIHHPCAECGGWFNLVYQDGQPVTVKTASPEEASLSAAGGWKENRVER